MARKPSKTKGVKIRPAAYEGRTPLAAVPSRAQRRANKPGYSGLRFEEWVRIALEDEGFHAWRRPGQRSNRLGTYGRPFQPDMAMTFFGLEQFGIEEMPNCLRTYRHPANILIEVKRQKVEGSALAKIGPALRDLAHVSDITNTLGILILDVEVFDSAQWKFLRAQADVQGVVLLSKNQIRRRTILSEVRRVAGLRAKLRAKFYAGTTKPKPRYVTNPDVVEFMSRENARKDLAAKGKTKRVSK